MDKIVYLVALTIWKGGDYSQKQTWKIFLEGLSETTKEQITDQIFALRAETCNLRRRIFVRQEQMHFGTTSDSILLIITV